VSLFASGYSCLAVKNNLAAALDLLARNAHPLLLIVAGLLTLGAVLAMLGVPLAGWAIYGLGHLGLLLALPAVAAVYRASMDRLTGIGLAVMYVGVVLGIPVVLMLLGYHLDNPAARDALMGYQLTPLGGLAGVVMWAGFAFVGVAAYSARSLPRGGAIAFILAAVLALPAELGVLGIPAWALGVLIASFGLAWIASPDEELSIP
jgi:hypothetical protein